MRKLFFWGLAGAVSLLLPAPARAQTTPVAATNAEAVTAAAAEPAPPTPSVKAEEVGATAGVPIPTGLSYFANADNYHSLSVGVQAGLGTSQNSPTFGYDNLAVSLQKKLGDNAIGKHIDLLVGFSDWRVPAFRKVFPDSVIDPLPKQDRFAAQSGNALAVGMALSFGRSDALYLTYSEDQQVRNRALSQLIRSPNYEPLSAKDTKDLTAQKVKTLADKVKLEVARLSKGHAATEKISDNQRDEWRQAQNAIPAQVRRAQQRQLGVKVGGLVRAASLAEETTVEAFDTFLTLAKGYGDVDFATSLHYLGYLDKKLPKHAFTMAGGMYLNTSTTGTGMLGLTVGYGWYTFAELYNVIPEARHLDKNPTTGRFDVVLSFSGAPGKEAQLPAGIGLRISHVAPSLLPASTSYSLVFSTNFSLIK